MAALPCAVAVSPPCLQPASARSERAAAAAAVWARRSRRILHNPPLKGGGTVEAPRRECNVFVPIRRRIGTPRHSRVFWPDGADRSRRGIGGAFYGARHAGDGQG